MMNKHVPTTVPMLMMPMIKLMIRSTLKSSSVLYARKITCRRKAAQPMRNFAAGIISINLIGLRLAHLSRRAAVQRGGH